MNYSFEYIDIILLAMIAGFIFLRLRGILGRRSGFEGKPATQFEKILKDVQERIQNEKKSVIKDLKNQVAQFSLDIAEKIIEKELEDKKKQDEVVKKMLKDLSIKK